MLNIGLIICIIAFIILLLIIKAKIAKLIISCILGIIIIIFILIKLNLFENVLNQKFINVDYDYSNDINDYGHISEKGAIKIAQEYAKLEKIVKANCNLDESNNYWNVTISLGDTGLGYDQKYFFKIDYSSGEVLDYTYTK